MVSLADTVNQHRKYKCESEFRGKPSDFLFVGTTRSNLQEQTIMTRISYTRCRPQRQSAPTCCLRSGLRSPNCVNLLQFQALRVLCHRTDLGCSRSFNQITCDPRNSDCTWHIRGPGTGWGETLMGRYDWFRFANHYKSTIVQSKLISELCGDGGGRNTEQHCRTHTQLFAAFSLRTCVPRSTFIILRKMSACGQPDLWLRKRYDSWEDLWFLHNLTRHPRGTRIRVTRGDRRYLHEALHTNRDEVKLQDEYKGKQFSWMAPVKHCTC